MDVILYTTSTCPYCKLLKTFLKEHNIDFQEKHVDSDDDARNAMVAVSGGFLGVPFLVVTKDGGEKETIIGFDKNRVKEVFDIKE